MSSICLNQSENQCCGCAACRDICPRGAITIVQDNNGFSVPLINNELCIECKKCQSVCQYIKKVKKSTPIEVYASACKNDEAMLSSASGGCFYAIAYSFIKAGGAVVGCAYDYNTDDCLIARHIIVQDVSELYRLQGSKYVQSDTLGIYNKIRELAQKGIPILFSGTPCQVAACKLSLGESFSNVYYVDIICHGVPSGKLFDGYIRYLEKKKKIKITNILFRDKKNNGWGLSGSIVYRKGDTTYKKPIKAGGSSYYAMFLQGQTYRSCCYQCEFAGEYRIGDVTLGDYWGVKNEHPEYMMANGGSLDENKGVSSVLINTSRGRELIEKCGEDLVLLSSEINKVAKHNAQLNHPSREGANRGTILNIFNNKGYNELEKWFFSKKGLKKIMYKAYEILPAKKING